MRKFTITNILLFWVVVTFGQLSGIKTIPGDYATIAGAIADLNTQGVGTGGVTFNVAAGHSEIISSRLTLTATGSPNSPIVFQKDGSGQNPLIIAYTGTATPSSATPDGIWALVGSDYVTIDGIDLHDPNTTNPATMEYGYGIFKASASDGAQNNTIKNCNIILNRVNNASGSGPMVEGSVGILIINSIPTAATTALTITTAAGTNSFNKIYSNTVQNCNYGIVLNGFAATAPFTAGDTHNDIGGSSPATGNIILNFGGAPSATNPSAGIRANNQWNINISYNTINNNNGSGVNHVSTLRGIFAQAGTSSNANINYNNITLQSGASTNACTAIDNGIGSTAASNTINIVGNIIQIGYPTATTGVYTAINNSATATTVNINQNNITQIPSVALAGTGTHVMIETGSPTNANVLNNTISNITRNGASGSWRIIKTTSPSNFVANGNLIENLSWSNPTSTGSIDAIYSFSSAVNVTANNNIIQNLSTPTTGTINGIREWGVAGNKVFQINQIYNFFTTHGGAGGGTFNGIFCTVGNIEISNNEIYNLNSTGTTGGTAGSINGVQISGGTNVFIHRNKIFNLSSLSSNPGVSGVLVSAGSNVYIYNNFISDLNAIVANAANPINGINITGGTSIFAYFNTVFLNTASSGSTFGTSAISANTTPSVTLSNNIFVNLSASNGTGRTVAYRRSSTTLTSYAAASNNNCFYAGTPSANNLIFFDGTNSDQTLADFKTRVSPRDGSSISVMPPFVNITTTPYDLHIQTNVLSLIESGGTIISVINVDIDGDIRWGSSGYAGTGFAPDIGADEFEGPPTCSTPVPGNTISSTTSLCFTQPVVLSLENTIPGTGVQYQWQSSSDGISFNNITNANYPTYNFTPIQNAYYRCMVVCLNGNDTAYSNPIFISFSNNITSTIPGGRCGAGTVTLEATANTGATISWYDAATGGNKVGTGSPFTTPFINTSTTFYVEAQTTSNVSAPIGLGAIQNTTTSYPAVYGNYYESSKHQMLILASELKNAGFYAGEINSLGFSVHSVGTSGIHRNFTIRIAATNLNALSSNFVTNGFTTVFGPLDYQPVAGINTHTFATPFVWDGVSNIIVETCFSNDPTNSGNFYTQNAIMNLTNTGFISTSLNYVDNSDACPATSGALTSVLRPNMLINGVSICSSPRVPVLASVGSSTPITITGDTSVCNNGVIKLEVLNGLSDYDQFTWTPIANLFTDAACTTPYVAGTSATEVFFKSNVAGITNITCQAYNTVTQCGATDDVNVTVLPSSVTITATPSNICNSGTTTINVTPVSGYGNATFQFAQSTDGINFNDIIGANGLSYTSGVLTNHTYFRWTASIGTNVCLQEQIQVIVMNPSITSTTPGSVCGQGSVTLGATSCCGSTILWYDSLNAVYPIASGTSFITPVLTASKNYYVEPYVQNAPFFVGRLDDPPSALASLGEYGMYFATTNAAIINSVQIYPSTAGNLNVFLVNNLSQVVDVRTFTISSSEISTSTKKTLNLNFYVPANVTGWMLYYDLAIYRGAGSYNYPYSANGFSITGNTVNGNNIVGGTRMYFYNWQVSPLCAGARQEVTATVTPAPTVSIDASDYFVCAGEPVTLTAQSTNNNYAYSWSNNSTGQTIVVNPTITSTYIVTASDSQSGCVTVDDVIIEVNPLPVATATANNSTITCGQTVQLTAGSLFTPDVLLENFNSLSHSFTTVNTSTGGNAAAAAWTLRPSGYTYGGVTFISPDNSQFILSNSDAQGSGGTTHTELISQTFSSVGVDSITIQFSHYYRHYTAGTAKVEIYDGSQWNTIQTWTSNQGAANNFANVVLPLSNTYLNNPNLKVRFVFDQSWGYYWAIDNARVNLFKSNTFSWSSIPVGFSSNIYNPTASPTTNTQYNVIVTSASNCSNTASVTVTVNNPSAPTVTVDNTCDVSILTAINYSGQLVWSTGESTPFILVTNSNPVNVYYISGACTSNVAIVNPAPIQTPDEPTVSDIDVCFGETVPPFTAVSNYNQFIWYNDPSLMNPVGTGATYQSPETNVGTYTYYVVAVNGICASSPAEVTLNIHALPNVSISQNGDTLFSSVPTGNQWYSLAQGLIVGATDNWYLVTVQDTYYVIVTDANGCSAASNSIHVVPTSISNGLLTDAISVIPNPAHNYTVVSLGKEKSATIQLISADGKIISENNVSTNRYHLSLKGLSAGIYTVRIITNNGIVTHKLLVE